MIKQRPLCISLASFAFLFIFAGSADSFAATVRCVPNASLDSSCAPTNYPTIQAAVTASAAGDIVLVGPGTYHEHVTVPQNDLVLLGAQAGNDPRDKEERCPPWKESIVDAANGAFVVTGSRVILDGFTVQGADTAHFAITVNGNGAKVFNNIIQKNAQAVCTSCGGGLTTQSGTSDLIVRQNLFRYENDGIFATNATRAIVSDNVFIGHNPVDPNGNAAAINFNSGSSDITVSNNKAYDNQTFIVVGPNTTHVEFSYNRGSRFSGTAVYVTGTNDQLVISNNDLSEGTARGIKLNQDFGAGTITHATISYNSIRKMGTYGIFVQNPADVGSMLPTLTSSVIIGNQLRDNGTGPSDAGLFIDVGNTGNFLTQNDVRDSRRFDCRDNSTGTGTLGTGNVWFDNIGEKSSPTGLCNRPWHGKESPSQSIAPTRRII